ncbi:MAG TPA: TadE/TadG family type IV pilus assembly protein [Actinomycetota bacterium]|nr:TadE/TadG family type IV pilus assembly protein [Actinomycetota bacterium]
MRRLLRREEGAAALEFGIILPILLALLAFVAPLVKFGYDYMVIQRAVSHGVRYASRADVNPTVRSDGSLGRRPLPSEVQAFVASSSGGKVQASTVSVSPNPKLAVPGEPITVEVDYELSYGPLADIANGISGAFFGGGASLPSSTTVTVSARGREE